MSKNVAVFVDVANIFYAAKAAGVDIDYTTLLKTATAGRDFVRAYAYTGLDPENENQRQFHAFLARSGYKVVSKDIRKYGDGKVKANLDIELVVDMMRTAQNLDIAVVVSGDGDFAPAIRAVQQMGVRVEVISFRGNTSSDLIEVADTFIDITQIAKVEKGSSRSGRRVAAEDDLSMTEVPDKESEGAPRRGRGGRGRARVAEREEAPPSVRAEAAPQRARRTTATGADLVVLPGEKLSKVAAAAPPLDEALEAPDDDAAVDLATVADAVVTDAEVGAEVEGEGPRRRRRRRGGRGRGRGRGPDREVPSEPGLAAVAGGADEEDEEDEDAEAYVAPRPPQASAFGSVWDSQIGVPTAPFVSAGLGANAEEEEDEDEPEIPEYLLAERRQRAGRPGGRPAQPGRGRGGRPGGRGGAYQSAVDRERYGRSGTGGGAYSGPRPDRGSRPDRGPRYGSGPRPDRAPRPERAPMREPAGASGGDPWSEVPPELEEMLRAELARKGGAQRTVGPEIEPATTEAAVAAPKRRASTRRAASSAPVADAAETTVAAEPDVGAKPRRRTTTPKAATTTDASVTDAAGLDAEAKPKRRTSTRRAAATAAPVAAASPDPSLEPVLPEAKPKRRTTTRKASAPKA